MLTIQTEAPPLEIDQDGVLRVGKTRVTLDTVIHAFNQGHTAEEITSHYPALKLADVYAVIAYYLNHQPSVHEYLQRQATETAQFWAEVETQKAYQPFRAHLLAQQATSQRMGDTKQCQAV
jgi:uncharacterized protein (DUF433 family)